MSRIATWKTFLCLAALLVWSSAARADYEAGQAAWKVGQYSEALAQWEAAAGTGDVRSMLALGRALVKGLGVPQDYVLAHKWLNLAAGRGNAEAAAEREALALKMTPQQIASAQEQARAWRPSVKAEAPKAAAKPMATASSPPAIPPPKRAIREAQALMSELGYKPGPADGAWGLRSEKAYAAFLRDAGLPPGKGLTLDGLRAMRGMAGEKAGTGNRASSTAAKGKANTAGSARTASGPAPKCTAWNTPDFFKAATPELVTRCLQGGVDVNDRGKYDNTPLHLAASYGEDPAVVVTLLRAGADPNAKNGGKSTPLHAAAWSTRHPAVIAELLKAGADLHAQDKTGSTPLHFAAHYNEIPAVVAALLKAGADPNAQAKLGSTPLHLAAHYNENLAVVTALLKVGANLRARDNYSNTPLHYAARANENLAVTAALLAAGADLNAQGAGWYTPLHYAARYNENPVVVAALLEAGADPNAKNVNDETPADLAGYFNKYPAVIAALKKAAAAHWSRTDLAQSGDCNSWLIQGDTQATLDFWKKATASKVQRCLETGANLRAQTRRGSTVLHFAALTGNAEAARALLAAGASVNARSNDGVIPLHWAAASLNVETVKLLLAAGANVRAEARKVKAPEDPILAKMWGQRGGATPLHWAISAPLGVLDITYDRAAEMRVKGGRIGPTPDEIMERWRLETAKLLITAGANINARDPKGMTPLNHAANHNSLETAKFLINAGAMLDVEDIWGHTALSRAAGETREGGAELLGALLAAGADACVLTQDGRTMLFDVMRARQSDMRGTDAWRRLQRAVQSC